MTLTAAIALVLARPDPVVRVRPSATTLRALLAATLATCLDARASAAVRRVRLAAAVARGALLDGCALTAEDEADAYRAALRLRERAREQPAADRTPVLVALMRELLADAPDCCEELDRAVRDAARAHGHEVTAEHEAEAARIVGG